MFESSKKLALLCACLAVLGGAPALSGPASAQDATMMPSPPESTESVEFEGAVVNDTASAGRRTYTVDKSQRGTTLLIPYQDIKNLCGDGDGCDVRLGMYNWDNTGRVASIPPFLLYFNPSNNNWRSSYGGGWSGTDDNGVVNHAGQAWACYFTDGVYKNWHANGDPSLGFGLLSWSDSGYVAGCVVTIID